MGSTASGRGPTMSNNNNSYRSSLYNDSLNLSCSSMGMTASGRGPTTSNNKSCYDSLYNDSLSMSYSSMGSAASSQFDLELEEEEQ